MNDEKNPDIKTIIYTIEYPRALAKRFEKEVIEKMEEDLHKMLSGWLSIRMKKEYQDKWRWF